LYLLKMTSNFVKFETLNSIPNEKRLGQFLAQV